MDKKTIIPQAAKPVVRVTQGSSTQLAELSEEVLSGTEGIAPHFDDRLGIGCFRICSMDDDAE